MTTTVGQLLANKSNNNNTITIKTANTSKTTTRTTSANSPHSPRHARTCPQSTIHNNNTYSTTLLLLLLAALMSTTAIGGRVGLGVGLAMAAPTAPNTAATLLKLNTAAARSPNRTRLQKRHDINSKAQFYNELNSPVLYWSNACGGKWIGPEMEASNGAVRPHKRCAQHKKLLRTVQNKVGSELRQLRRDNKDNKAIDLSQYRIWETQSGQYSFLPRLNNSDNQLSLRRAHQDLQFFVAAFSYLRDAQVHYDYEHLLRQSVLSHELLRLRTSARTVLCIVEEAINGSSQLYAPNQKQQHQQQRHQQHKLHTLGRIKTVSAHVMEKRLQQFQTPLVELHRQAVLAVKPTKPPVELDMLFMKYQYIKYLKHMTQLLAKQRKRNCISRPHKVAPQRTQPRKQQRKPQRKKA